MLAGGGLHQQQASIVGMLGLLPNEDTERKRRWRPFLQDLAWSSFPHSECLFCPQQGQSFRTMTVPLHPQLQRSTTLTSAPPPGPLLTITVLILTLKLQQTQASCHPIAIFATLTLQIQTGPSYPFSGLRTTSVQFLFSFSSHKHFHPLRPGVRHSQYPQILPWFLVTFHWSLAIPDHGKFSLSFTHWRMNLSLKWGRASPGRLSNLFHSP